MKCVRLPGTKHGICAGDLTKKITVSVRSLEAPDGSSVDFSEDFTTKKEVWAMVRTTDGTELFDGVNLSNAYTHEFYIRFIPGSTITVEDWVEFNSARFKIESVVNLEESDQFYQIKAKFTGSMDKAASKSFLNDL